MHPESNSEISEPVQVAEKGKEPQATPAPPVKPETAIVDETDTEAPVAKPIAPTPDRISSLADAMEADALSGFTKEDEPAQNGNS